jgi:Protein of unknown function (DUF2852)
MHQMVDRMDDVGRPAWIGLMVVAFIVFWPLGLGLLAFLLWSGRMGCGGRFRFGGDHDRRDRIERKIMRMRERLEQWGPGGGEAGQRAASGSGMTPSGNRAFDEYRQDTLKRLEEEANDFRGFLDRLRMAKDKSEFDQFMTDRRSRPTGPAGPQGGPQGGDGTGGSPNEPSPPARM